MTDRERKLAAARFEHPDRIPAAMFFTGDCWEIRDNAELDEVMAAHPGLWPDHTAHPPDWRPTHAPWRRAGVRHTDSWGCVWETMADGCTGAVVHHPLSDWSDFEAYRPPDPKTQMGWTRIDWEAEAERAGRARSRGALVGGGLRHGFLFLTLTYIRGFENLLFDMIDGHPRLSELITVVENFNAAHVQRWLDIGVEWLTYPEDLGMQVGPMLSPNQFRTWIAPVYKRLMAPARDRGALVYMHSDGDVRTLADDLIDCGVQVLNIQDLVNGIDWMRDHLKGRVALDVDIDRQNLTVHGSPSEVDEHVHRIVSELADPAGGLMLKASVGPAVPLHNMHALATALEHYCR